MLPRVLEPELMNTEHDARQYDTMDHAEVNAQFATGVLHAIRDWSLQRPEGEEGRSQLEVLDLGTGTAQIPIELCCRSADVRVVALDAAASMLDVARDNVAAAALADRIELVLGDAKRLPLEPGRFAVVISNSIVHHVAEPRQVIAEAIRVMAPGGLQFHRDLCRPNDQTTVQSLVSTYAGDATPYQRKLLADSLRAALTINEMQQLVERFGFRAETVRMTSDRHWTWLAP